VRIYVPEGFVVAADGLRIRADGGIHSTNQQKLFSIQDSERYFAYGCTGASADEFSFSEQVKTAADSIAGESILNFHEYLVRVSALIQQALLNKLSASSGLKFPDLPGGTISTVLFAGYYQDEPWLGEIKFSQENNGLRNRAPNCSRCSPGKTSVEISGSKTIWNSLLGDDPRVSKYRLPSIKKLEGQTPTLGDALEIAKSYLSACIDPLACEIDSDCASIGGHFHIATITPSHGFSWEVKPTPP
jgi:hypothetical protein